MKRRMVLFLMASIAARAADYLADSVRGKQLFETLSCVQCHSVNGKGGSIGPDLGSIVDRGFTPASLAATMWNHAPKMWTAMRQQGVHSGVLTEKDAANLFAYFYSARFFEAPGDAARGSQNVLYPMKTALSRMATLGEVADVLRAEFGVYTPR